MKIKIFCRCSFFFPGRAKDLSATRYYNIPQRTHLKIHAKNVKLFGGSHS